MSCSGQIYGVALNDRRQLDSLADAFQDKPYLAAPKAPVVYMKPACAVAQYGIVVPRGRAIVVSTTIALILSRDVTMCQAELAMDHVGAMCVALETSLPQKDYYRPAIPQTIRESSMALGEWVPVRPIEGEEITLQVADAPIHSWRLDRLHRKPARLISDLSQFMTLRAGDVLLIGLPGDAPVISGVQRLQVAASGLPLLDVLLAEEQA